MIYQPRSEKRIFSEESIDHHIHGVSSKISNTP